jgi:hypothetical protein
MRPNLQRLIVDLVSSFHSRHKVNNEKKVSKVMVK